MEVTNKPTENSIDYDILVSLLCTISKKIRQILLLEKILKNKVLSPREINEVRRFENADSAPPRIVQSQQEIAKVFGVSLRTVQRWVREDMPRMNEGYDLLDIQAWCLLKKYRNVLLEPSLSLSWRSKNRLFKILRDFSQ
jgi:DNA-binding transcriptional regulator YiaG